MHILSSRAKSDTSYIPLQYSGFPKFPDVLFVDSGEKQKNEGINFRT